MANIDFARLLEKVQSEASFVNTTIKDKGSKRFGRPLVISGLVIFLSYWFIYKPPGEKIAGLQKKIDTAKATAQYADQFKDIRLRLLMIYSKLPGPESPGVSDLIVESLKAEGIIPDSLQPPVESEIAGLRVQTVNVTLTVKFSELMAWLLRLEHSKPALHLQNIELRKKSTPIGRNEVMCTLVTAVPKVRY